MNADNYWMKTPVIDFFHGDYKLEDAVELLEETVINCLDTTKNRSFMINLNIPDADVRRAMDQRTMLQETNTAREAMRKCMEEYFLQKKGTFGDLEKALKKCDNNWLASPLRKEAEKVRDNNPINIQ